MRAFRLAGVALVPLFACFGSSTGSPADGGVDAQSADTFVPVEAGGGDAPTTGPSCTMPATGTGTMQGSVSKPETWTQAGSPYVLLFDIEITAPLTLEPCTTVLIPAQKTVSVTTGGSIVAKGTAAGPVFIAKKDTANWASIRALTGGTLSFDHTNIDGGGDPLNGSLDFTGALDIRADSTTPLAEILHANTLSITSSMGQGIYLHAGGAFSADSAAVSISGSKGYPIHASANLAGTIPADSGSLYTQNAINEILLSGANAGETIITWDVKLRDVGVPYHIGASSEQGRLDVGGSPAGKATLTIDPNVTLRFKKGGVLYVDFFSGSNPATGAMVAVGTQQKPIVFTSAEGNPAAGDWLGLNFGDVPSSTSKLDFVTIAFAGGSSGSGSGSCPYPGTTINDAAIRIHGPPPSAFITNGSITDSLTNGIDRGWAANNLTDFLTDGTNKFARVPGCTQTYPKDSNNGGCPTPVPCPK